MNSTAAGKHACRDTTIHVPVADVTTVKIS